MRRCLLVMLALVLAGPQAHAAPLQLFPLADVRLADSPFLDAQRADLAYLLELEPDRLLAPFLREAGLPLRQPSYGNWESSGLDGHLGGHYLTAMALMYAATGDAEVLRRLNYFVAELKRCQQANGNGYLGGIPGGGAAWAALAAGKLQVDNFSVNGKWVPWYNLHKVFAGLRDAYRYAGNDDARQMLIALSDWALALTAPLSPQQMQAMLGSEHGGMNEVLADVAELTGDARYMALAIRFSHQAVLQPLQRQQDQLTGLHANTQIPKVIGFKRIGDLTGQPDWQRAAAFFWQTVHDKRSVAIGGNSVKEHFHDEHDFTPMIDDVEGPETCNTYNMLKLTELLFLGDPRGAYADYYERALYNHILSSQHPGDGGLVYFTPMRPNHYRVYSQVDKAMWCCVGSGIESQAKYGEFIYAHRGDELYVNLFIASTLTWRARHVTLRQENQFPDQAGSSIVVGGGGRFALKIRYPSWVRAGALTLRLNGRRLQHDGRPGGYITLRRDWRDGDRITLALPMQTTLEQMPDRSNYYAVLHGPIVLAAKTQPVPGEHLQFMADDSRMGHIAQGPLCPLDTAPLFVSDRRDFLRQFKPVPGQPLTFRADGLVLQPGQPRGAAPLTLIPFFRLHDARYMLYWQVATPSQVPQLLAATGQAEAGRLALARNTVDQVAPGEQQPEVDHAYAGAGADSGIDAAHGRHWRRATAWFSYRLRDPGGDGRLLRLTFAGADAGQRFAVQVNGQPLAELTLAGQAGTGLYERDLLLPAGVAPAADGALEVRLVAGSGSLAGPLYGLRLLRQP